MIRKLQSIVTALIGMFGFTVGTYYADLGLTAVSLCMFILTLGYEVIREEDQRNEAASNARWRKQQAEKKA